MILWMYVVMFSLSSKVKENQAVSVATQHHTWQPACDMIGNNADIQSPGTAWSLLVGVSYPRAVPTERKQRLPVHTIGQTCHQSEERSEWQQTNLHRWRAVKSVRRWITAFCLCHNPSPRAGRSSRWGTATLNQRPFGAPQLGHRLKPAPHEIQGCHWLGWFKSCKPRREWIQHMRREHIHELNSGPDWCILKPAIRTAV